MQSDKVGLGNGIFRRCGGLLAILLSFISGIVFGQNAHYRFTQLDVDQGLSNNQVLSFFKDKQGFLWIGTNSGLNRFDGYTIKVFRSDPHDSTTLSDNIISRLFEMPGGKMGVLTGSGLNIYNPRTENFETSLEPFQQELNLPEGNISQVAKDDDGNFWFIYASDELAYFKTEDGKTVLLHHDPDDTTSIASGTVASITQRGREHWIIHTDGTLEQLDVSGETSKVVFRDTFLKRRYQERSLTYRLLTDSDGDLWIYPVNDPQGVYYYNVNNKTFRHFHTGSKDLKLNTDIVASMIQDDDGLLWIGTDHGGVNLLDKKNFTVRYLSHQEGDSKSLAQNSVTTLYKDSDGIIWVGTFKKGVSYYHKNIVRFPLYWHNLLNHSGLPYDDVNRFVEDDKGNLWIGTNGGGLIYFDRDKNSFRQYHAVPDNPDSLSSDVIVSLCYDHQGKLWIGTYYGGLNCFDGRKFTRYNYDPSDTTTLSNRNVWEVFEDASDRLWVGTLGSGIDLLDRKTGKFSHFRSGPNSIQSNYILAITEDRKGNLWLGTSYGVDVLMKETNRFVHYGNKKNDRSSLSDNIVMDIREDAAGRIWVATQNGLDLFNEQEGNFRAFKQTEGLPHNSILTILDDNNGNLWLGTPNGISNMIITQGASGDLDFKFRNYDESDGLQGKQFNENAAFKTSRDELIFGGADGFNIFKPEQIGLNTTPPNVAFTDFQLFNKSLRANEKVGGRTILTEPITRTDEIVLPSAMNVFSIEFTALNFFHPEKNEYKYLLEGFNSDWLSVGSDSRKVTFTNLDPGEYTLRVKAANNDGFWNEEGTRLKITVLPPFWKTKTAFAIYVLLIIMILVVIRKIIQQQERMKFVIKQERMEAQRLHELDMMKIKFFTNVSHEFRTPLTLILTPLDRILTQLKEHEFQGQFKMIQRNARRLLNLVNQLLDFRKLEVKEVKFNPSEGDIIMFIKETVSSFSDLSEQRGVGLVFSSSVESLETIFDQAKLERILFNLLSNAFKFTPEKGQVTVHVNIQNNGTAKWLVIEVQDTGIGIPADKQEKIFEQFFQSDLPVSMVNQGSGIGLSIASEFVKIHKGTISVKSEPGKGSCFTVNLPVSEVAGYAHVTQGEVIHSPDATSSEEWIPEESFSKKPVLLLVEDNEDFRFYLKDNLKAEYTILQAGDGRAGLKMALMHIPDMIVSDVMMPEMDGMEFCRRIKQDQHTSHIPFILLTARAADEQKLDGFNTGADDYITKPFNFEILLSRIHNLLRQREKFHKAFHKHFEVKASELNITSMDEKFIKKAIQCVEENVSTPGFTVEDLSRHMGISRANLYKKMLSLTGRSPLEFIRTIRLQQAAQLLEKSQLTVAEVAYQVGFNNPKYFTKYFKEEFDILPSHYAASKQVKK